MPFINDLSDSYAWADPAPIGYVEPGWAAIASELLHRIDALLTASPGPTVDILDVSVRSNALGFDALRFDFVLDKAGHEGPSLVAAIISAVEDAKARSRITCPYSGRPRSNAHVAGQASTVMGASPQACVAMRSMR